jgi:hypothetical protein
MEDLVTWAAAQPWYTWPILGYGVLTAIVAATPTTRDDEALGRAESAVLGLLVRLSPLRRGSLKLPGSAK